MAIFKSDYYCNNCKNDISDEEYGYSLDHFGRALCRRCQKDVKKSTPEAKRLGKLLSKNWKVELEKWDGYKHIDIAIPKSKVNIEVDGKQHNLDEKQALADLKRTYFSFKKGWVTLRIPNCLVRNTKILKETADFIDNFLKTSEDQID